MTMTPQQRLIQRFHYLFHPPCATLLEFFVNDFSCKELMVLILTILYLNGFQSLTDLLDSGYVLHPYSNFTFKISTSPDIDRRPIEEIMKEGIKEWDTLIIPWQMIMKGGKPR